MDPILLIDSSGLTLTNAALGIACFAALAVVVVAVWFDVRERRRWRASVPDAWPPPGLEDDPPRPAAPQDASAPSRPVARRP